MQRLVGYFSEPRIKHSFIFCIHILELLDFDKLAVSEISPGDNNVDAGFWLK